MERLAGTIETAIRALLRPVVFLAVAALVVVITAQIVFRTAFTALGWTEEVARYLLVWLTFLGAVLALAESRHIAVTVLTDRLSPKNARRVARISQLAACAFFVALAIVAWRYMQLQSFQKSASLRVPMLYIYSVIPACSTIMALLSLLRAITGRDIHGPAAPDVPLPTPDTPAPDTLPVTEDRP
ncbi:hypothetical protein CBW24_17335 (plasmid) [Pacificitalea manganoxidans]|uniref:TRAP transporter small permease protein n=1 Tax=Pacificitalea manganoxidans TaxID=1411902 RepID=A0A291M4J4_9RHOB|nr:TRAP transporter small permease [Pacificitalea manganoxidans]ATI43896.1 hypothetical protein CBW24_17335 [Pacificitalea manganoxidans]MDR6310196.1 TRAP-type C4-dicarboxylate transport system permease small subunit [Pacificitalea manganoxidans]